VQPLLLVSEPCALNAEFLIKFPYFADTTERVDRGGESRPKEMVKTG